MFDFSFSYSLLKSDPNLDCAQQTHCDQASPNSYGTDKLFTFSAIVGIEKVQNSIIDINKFRVNLVLMSETPTLGKPLLPDPLLGIAKMSYDNTEEPVLKKKRIYVQKCMICNKVGDEICNQACNQHRDEVRVKQNLQRSTSHKKSQGLGVNRVPFKVRYNSTYNKVTSYF